MKIVYLFVFCVCITLCGHAKKVAHVPFRKLTLKAPHSTESDAPGRHFTPSGRYAFRPTLPTDDDPFGLRLKKLILDQLFDELPKRGMPSATNSADNSTVYIFLVGRKNVTAFQTDILAVPMYSDTTWPSAKDLKRRFARQVGLPAEKVVMAGFFSDSSTARTAWSSFKDKTFAYEVNRVPVAFEVLPDFSVSATPELPLSIGKTVSRPAGSETRLINLPDLTIVGKYRPTLGVMPIIDTETNLNQQFLVCQYLTDNLVILNQKDTIRPSLADYRAYTQYAIGGTMDQQQYILKLWQKEKQLAEIVIPLKEKITLEERMTLIGSHLGRILSGDTDNYTIRQNSRNRNLIDNLPVIKSEIRKGTEISALFPNATMHYFPDFELPATLSHLSGRISNKPFQETPGANIMAEKIRAIYQQADEKQFFFTNGNIPEDMKAAVRKITQPTSRRIGSALSYVAVGDVFRSGENNLDGAACSYYSALLLAHNLAASPLEKATVKQLVYERMKRVAETRKQPYLADLFTLATDLNTSFISSSLAQASHRDYYDRLQKTASLCLDAENKARAIRAEQRMAGLQTLVAVAGEVAQAGAGKTYTKLDEARLSSQIQSFMAPVQQMQAAFAETFEDVKYENFDVQDESGNEIELNKLYLNLEVLWHLGLRKDMDVVGKRLLAYAADKPNLKMALEEYLSEDDENLQAVAIQQFQRSFQTVEVQANSYESWGRKVPKKVVARF